MRFTDIESNNGQGKKILPPLNVVMFLSPNWFDGPFISSTAVGTRGQGWSSGRCRSHQALLRSGEGLEVLSSFGRWISTDHLKDLVISISANNEG